MTEKLARRGLTVPGEYEVGVMSIVRVGAVMSKDVKPIPADMLIGELAERMVRGKPAAELVTRGKSRAEDTMLAATAKTSSGDGVFPRGEPAMKFTGGLPIVGSDGLLVGIVTQGDLLRALETDPKGTITVLEAGSDEPIVAFPDESVHDAMSRMLHHDIGRLPIVSREEPRKMVGYFNRSNILGAWTRQMEEEGIREHGWLAKWRNAHP
jgi:CIC family chloride channel protein